MTNEEEEKQLSERCCDVGSYRVEEIKTNYYIITLGNTTYRYTKDELFQLRNMLNRALAN